MTLPTILQAARAYRRTSADHQQSIAALEAFHRLPEGEKTTPTYREVLAGSVATVQAQRNAAAAYIFLLTAQGVAYSRVYPHMWKIREIAGGPPMD